MPDSTTTAGSSQGMFLVLASILLGSCAQLMLKLGTNGLAPGLAGIIDSPWPTVLLMTLGLAAYGLSMLLWMMALANYELSFAYPLLSTSYILVYLGAVLLPQLGETVSIAKSTGIILIVAGVIFVTRSRRQSAGKKTSPQVEPRD